MLSEVLELLVSDSGFSVKIEGKNNNNNDDKDLNFYF